MAGEVAAGAYHIMNVANLSLAFDLADNATADVSPIELYSLNYSDAQVWNVVWRADSSLKLVHRYSGKTVDMTNLDLRSQAPIYLYRDNDTDAQRWDLLATGNTATYGGKTYPTYRIRLAQYPSWFIDVESSKGAVQNSRIVIANQRNNNAQTWIFVPIPKYHTNGLYEIHSIMDGQMLFDINGNDRKNVTEGAYLMLNRRNGGNNQKFILERDDSYLVGGEPTWAIRCVHSGMYLDILGNEMAAGTAIGQWPDDDTPAQRFVLEEYGTAEIEGVTCQVVSICASTNTNYLLDALYALTTAGTQVVLGTNNQGPNQEWALYPTSAVDDNMPAPYNIGLSTRVKGPGYTVIGAAEKLYPTWECAPGWIVGAANHYQWRYRARYLNADTTVWGDWPEFGSWQDTGITVEGSRVWVTEGLGASADFDISQYKQLQIGIQVRTAGGDAEGLNQLLGPISYQVINVYKEATITLLSNGGFSPEGIRFDYTSDYTKGVNYITFTNIKKSDGTVIFDGNYRTSGSDAASSVLLPVDLLTAWPSNGGVVTVTYETATDASGVTSDLHVPHTAEVTISYDANHDTTVTPTYTLGPGRSIEITVPHMTKERAWLVGSTSLIELNGTVSDNSTKFVGYYPFGSAFYIYATGINDDNDRWWTKVIRIDASDPIFGKMHSCHAFNWDDGYLLIEARPEEYLATDVSNDLSYTEYKLNGRSRSVMHYGSVTARTFKIAGIVIDSVTESSRADVDTLIAKKHVIYRSPHGDLIYGAVTSVSYTVQFNQYDVVTVDISITEEEF